MILQNETFELKHSSERAIASTIRALFDSVEVLEEKRQEEAGEREATRYDLDEAMDLLDYVKATAHSVMSDLTHLSDAFPEKMRHRLRSKQEMALDATAQFMAWLGGGAGEALDKCDDVSGPPAVEFVGAMTADDGLLNTLHVIMHEESRGSQRRHAMEAFSARLG